MLKIIALAVLSSTACAGEINLSVGTHDRPGGADAAIEYSVPAFINGLSVGGELAVVDFGEQPHTATRNRAINIGAVARYALSKRVSVLAKAGMTSTALSSPYRPHDWNKGFAGSNAGVGLEYRVTESMAVRALVQNHRYVQCSQNGMNDYLYYSLGLKYKF
jgi:opacity protein-like surface antigen